MIGSSPAFSSKSRTVVMGGGRRPTFKSLRDGLCPNRQGLVGPGPSPPVPEVETTDPDGVDFGWVMQVTFVVTIAVGAPLVAALSLGVRLPDWGARAAFAVRVGAVVWFLTAIAVYIYARRYREPAEGVDDGGSDGDAADDDGEAG